MQMNSIRPRKFYGSGQPARNGEASICREETNACSGMTPRGVWGWHVEKDQSGTWEARCSEGRTLTESREYITLIAGTAGVGEAHSSDEAG